MITYTTNEGDRVDQVANQLFGRVEGVVELIYDSNAGLAEYPAELPGGLVLTIPDPPEPEAEKVQLWE